MERIKPSEVANICAFRILPAIAFVAFSVYSFNHKFGGSCTTSDCFYTLVVGAWIIAGMIGVTLLVLYVIFVVGCFVSDKWNDWMDKMDSESGF